MLAGRHDFVIEQGQDFVRYINWEDSSGTTKDLSGGSDTATLKLRPWRGHSGTIDSGYNIGTSDSILDTGGGEITLTDGSGGYNIKIEIADTVTDDLDFEVGDYTLEVYDDSASTTYRVLEGRMFLRKETLN